MQTIRKWLKIIQSLFIGRLSGSNSVDITDKARQAGHSVDSLSFDRLPTTIAVQWLRDFASQIVIDLVHTRQAEYSRYLDVEQHPALLSAGAIRSESLQQITRVAAQSFEEWEDLWQSRTAQAINMQLGVNAQGFTLPNSLWELLGQQAWEDPDFRQSLAERLEYHLSELWLYPFGALPVPVFHVNTIWLLLAGAPAQVRKARLRIIANANAGEFLTSFGEQIANASEGWAGYWDQWILKMAYSKWGNDAAWSSEARASIGRLPLIETPGLWRSGHEYLSDSWFEDVPDWFRILVNTDKSNVRIEDAHDH